MNSCQRDSIVLSAITLLSMNQPSNDAAAYEAEYGDFVVIIDYFKRTKDLIKCGATGSHIVDYQNISLANHRA